MPIYDSEDSGDEYQAVQHHENENAHDLDLDQCEHDRMVQRRDSAPPPRATNQNKATPLVTCQLKRTELMIQMLQAVHFQKDQPAFLTFQDLGIKVTVEKSKTLQARAYLKKAMFSDWSMRDSGELENVVIQINLTILLQCLTIFGSNAHLELTLQEEGDPLSLMLEEGGVITQCNIATLIGVPEPMNVYGTSVVLSRVQLQASALKDVLGDTEINGGVLLHITFSPDAPFFSLAIKGRNCESEVSFPNDGDLFAEFDCHEQIVQAYSVAHFRLALNSKQLPRLSQVGFRVRSNGYLSITHTYAHDDMMAFIEFILAPSVEEEATTLSNRRGGGADQHGEEEL